MGTGEGSNGKRSSDIRYARDGLVLFNEQIGLTPTRLNLQSQKKSFRLTASPSGALQPMPKLTKPIAATATIVSCHFCCTFVFIHSLSFSLSRSLSLSIGYVRWLTFCLRKKFLAWVCSIGRKLYKAIAAWHWSWAIYKIDYQLIIDFICSTRESRVAGVEYYTNAGHDRR